MAEQTLRLGIDSTGARSGARSFESAAGRAGRAAKGAARDVESMEGAMNRLSRAADGMRSVGRKLTMFVSLPLAAAGGFAVKAATEMDSLTLALDAMTGSSAETAVQLKRLQDVARSPGLGFKEAVQGSINLQAVGMAAGDAERALKAFGNAVATTGGGKSELDRVLFQLSQMAALGRVSSLDLRPIIQTAPAVAKALNELFGSTSAEAIAEQTSGFREFFDLLIPKLESMPSVAGGARNAMDNLSDSMFRARAAIGDQLLPVVLPLVTGLADWLEKLESVNPETIRWGLAIAGVATVAGPLVLTLGLLATAAASAATAMAAFGVSAAVAAGVLTGGLGLIALLGGLSAMFLKNKADAAHARAAVDDYRASLSELSKEAAGEKAFDIQRQVADLEAEKAGLPATVNQRSWMGREFVIQEVANPRIAEIDEQIKGLNQELGIVARRLTDIRNTGNDSITNTVTTPLVDAKEAARKLRDELKALDRAIRNMRYPAVSGGPGSGVRLTEEGRQRGKEADRRRSEFLGAGGTLTQVTVGPGGDPNAGAKPMGAFSGVIDAFKTSISGVIAQFGPLAAVAAALAPVFRGFKDAIGPALEALKEPLRTIGELIGLTLVPALTVLEGPLKLLALATSYVVEHFGWMIRSIGKVIDALPFISGKKIIKAGQDMMDGARNARRGMNTLADTTDRLTSSLLNFGNVIHINALRNSVAAGLGGGGGRGGGGGGGSGGGGGGGGITPPGLAPGAPRSLTVNLMLDGRAIAQTVIRDIEQSTLGGAPSALQVAFG